LNLNLLVCNLVAMIIRTIILVFTTILIFSCENDPKNTSTAAPTATESEETKTTFIREPVDIVASTGEDYPSGLKGLDFPVLPNAEVSNVGNTDIENGTVLLQLQTLSSMDQIKKFYRAELPKRSWTEKEMKIFQGADSALSFRTDDYTARFLIIDDKVQDFRKIAITLNKRVKLEDFE